MKKYSIAISFVLVGFISAFAQENTKIISKSSEIYKSSKTVNIDGRQKSNSSISISNSNDSYKLRANFSKEKTEKIKSIIISEMDKKKPRVVNGKYIWTTNSKSNEVYKINLTKGKIYMFIDKEVASSDLVEKFDNIGILIKSAISDSDTDANSDTDAGEKQRDADRLLRDAERMRSDAARIQREANRYNKEAEQYKKHANNLEEEAKHKGGVSTIIKKLLADDKTIFNEGLISSDWKWFAFQKEFLTTLVKDAIVKNTNKINMTIDNFGYYVNGKRLNQTQMNTCNRLFNTYNFHFKDFSFYKQNKHIVIVDEANANIEAVINALKENNLIHRKIKNTTIEINGNSVVKDGKSLSKEEVSVYNKLLQHYNFIPAPGKIIEISNYRTMKIGYKIGSKTFIGTWVQH